LGLLYGAAENLNVKTDTTLKLAELKGEDQTDRKFEWDERQFGCL
jgi:hypothetical protein